MFKKKMLLIEALLFDYFVGHVRTFA